MSMSAEKVIARTLRLVVMLRYSHRSLMNDLYPSGIRQFMVAISIPRVQEHRFLRLDYVATRKPWSEGRIARTRRIE